MNKSITTPLNTVSVFGASTSFLAACPQINVKVFFIVIAEKAFCKLGMVPVVLKQG